MKTTTNTAATFPTAAVLSLTTGRLLRKCMDEMHGLIEHVAGHPVWTHELANRASLDAWQAAVFAQHPALRGFDVSDVCDPATAEAAAKRGDEMFGATLSINAGTGTRTKSPLETAADAIGADKVVAVTTR